MIFGEVMEAPQATRVSGGLGYLAAQSPSAAAQLHERPKKKKKKKRKEKTVAKAGVRMRSKGVWLEGQMRGKGKTEEESTVWRKRTYEAQQTKPATIIERTASSAIHHDIIIMLPCSYINSYTILLYY